MPSLSWRKSHFSRGVSACPAQPLASRAPAAGATGQVTFASHGAARWGPWDSAWAILSKPGLGSEPGVAGTFLPPCRVQVSGLTPCELLGEGLDGQKGVSATTKWTLGPHSENRCGFCSVCTHLALGSRGAFQCLTSDLHHDPWGVCYVIPLSKEETET
jgi:hypothetical protein